MHPTVYSVFFCLFLQSHFLWCWHDFCDVMVTPCNVSVTSSKWILHVGYGSDITHFCKYIYILTWIKRPIKRKTKIGTLYLRMTLAYCRSKVLPNGAFFRPSLSLKWSLRPLFCLFLKAFKTGFTVYSYVAKQQ